MDNPIKYGFRFARSRWGRTEPTPLKMTVATAESFDVSSGTSNVFLGPGDPVVRLSTGGVTLCPATSPPFGVVVGVGPYWNGTFMEPTDKLPSDTAWGTILDRQSTVYVVPFEQAYWEIDCDDAATATTKAAYQAFVNENCSFILCGGVSGHAPTTNSPARAHPRLDIATHAVTDSLILRIVAVSDTVDNQDFTGNYVKMIVELNISGTGGAAGLATASKGI